MRGQGCWIPYQSMRQLKTRKTILLLGFLFRSRSTQDYKPENGENHMYSGTAYLEVEDGEPSWFNAGVRVGVGIGLSICVGVGIGVGLLVRTYQDNTRNFQRQLL
ncbi:unnamed protein product [Malus baccata var. baccata]